MPEEHLTARMNPAKGFHDAFGIPYEAHLEPVWPRDRKKHEPKIRSYEDMARYLSGTVDLPQEQFMVALLDTRGALIGVVVIFKGTINEVPVHMREVFAAAIAGRAAAIIGIHNHPSGDVTPSEADLHLSKSMMEASEIIGIPVLDHIIIGKDYNSDQPKSFSLAANGLLGKSKTRSNPDRFDAESIAIVKTLKTMEITAAVKLFSSVLSEIKGAFYDDDFESLEKVARLADPKDPVLYIYTVGVERKGRGHGRRLVEWVENKAVKHGALHSLLIASTLSDEDEHPAPFWEAVGYERITGNIDGDGIFAKRLA
jgi:GNAT superfamily N-acetyltransferase